MSKHSKEDMSPEIALSFLDLKLCQPIQKALQKNDYKEPSPIQAKGIPVILEGKDLIGSAQTGTGKTAAFALPILHILSETYQGIKPHQVRSLVLTPTRELAVQIEKSFSRYGKHLQCRRAVVYGGVRHAPQIRALEKGVDVLVATPGRLMDLHNSGHMDLSELEILVLDEADRMLDMGFIHDIKAIVSQLPSTRQTLFFSATMSGSVKKLAEQILKDPVHIAISPNKTTAEKIDQYVCFLDQENKLQLLLDLLQEQDSQAGRRLTLIFSRTKSGANQLASTLNHQGIRAEAIHGDKTQSARQKALERFSSGKSSVMVATDVAARGIDIKNLTLVVNYELPDEAESYVHRIGRTARAGAEGKSVSFCARKDLSSLLEIEKLIRRSIPVETKHPHHSQELQNRFNNYIHKPFGAEERYLRMKKSKTKGGQHTSKEGRRRKQPKPARDSQTPKRARPSKDRTRALDTRDKSTKRAKNDHQDRASLPAPKVKNKRVSDHKKSEKDLQQTAKFSKKKRKKISNTPEGDLENRSAKEKKKKRQNFPNKLEPEKAKRKTKRKRNKPKNRKSKT